jgi:hypothetical protein
MHVVALTQACGDVEKEAPALAPLLGVSAYDARAWLGGVLPRLVYKTPAESHALELVAKLRARGHGALALDTDAVVPGTSMVHMHRFVLGDLEIVPNDDLWDRLAYRDIAAVVVVARRMDAVRRTVSLDSASDWAMGRLRTRQAALEQHIPRQAPEALASFDHVYDRVAYLFPRSGPEGAPRRTWMLHEREGQYLSLGPKMQPTQRANFKVTLDILRERAPSAIFDDRFVTSPRALESVAQVRGHDAPTPELTDRAVEILVHALATWLLSSRGGPYR